MITTTTKQTNKKRYTIEWTQSDTTSERYGLLISTTNGLAVDCSCKDRHYRGRKQGRACKHMMRHNGQIHSVKASEHVDRTLKQPVNQPTAQPSQKKPMAASPVDTLSSTERRLAGMQLLRGQRSGGKLARTA
jgi:hypothetical protein